MGIFSNYIKRTVEISETETVMETITLPNDLPEDDPDYEFRGQTIEKEFPKTIINDEIFENVYIQIISFQFYKREIKRTEESEVEFKNNLDLHYRVYQSKEARDANFDDFIEEEHVLGQFIDINSGDDLRVLGYNLLKDQVFITDAVDDL